MKKIITFPVALLSSIIAVTALIGCDQNAASQQANQPAVVKQATDKQQVSASEAWLKSIFSQCKSGHGYCLPDDENIFTKRYLEFYQEQLQIFAYPDFTTEDKLLAAKKAYKNKWKDIYPLDKEVWSPFGQGNGMMAGDTLENVSITRIADLQYNVLIEYHHGEVSSNNLLLIPSGGTFLIDFIDTTFKEEQAVQVKISDPGIDKILPVFMNNKANTTLYDDASVESGIVATLPDEDNFLLIGVKAIKDKANNLWYKTYYPKEQIQGWTREVSHWDLQDGEISLPFLQNLTLAQLQLGATPDEAKRLLGKPKSELIEVGPVEVSGYIDEEDIVTTTTLEYDGIRLVYADERMTHALINKAGKSFGWIVCGDKNFNQSALLKKFKVAEQSIYVDEQGHSSVFLGGMLSLKVLFDKNKLIKSIEFYTGP